MPSYKDQVLNECWRIATIARAMAEAAERQFMAPIDDPEFETGDGADYAGGMRVLRIQIERVAARTEGVDPMLDESLHEYQMRVLRTGLQKDRPALFIN
ncbi:MAG TPA: hypothetical protein VFA33_05115 [Bryobacteraceae bacterium]|nr:hypothetical protein [Bryobacteraceae bacterium]